MKVQPYGIHWFRRDLRVAGNAALHWNRQKHGGRVVGLFCCDATMLVGSGFSANRFGFFLKTLQALREELRDAGSDLLVLDCQPTEALRRLAAAARPGAVSFSGDYEPRARARDARVSALLTEELGVPVHTERDHLVFEPWEITKDGGADDYYKVYTPYAKRWLQRSMTAEFQTRIDAQREGLAYLEERLAGVKPQEPLFCLGWKGVLGTRAKTFPDACDGLQKKNAPLVTVPLPEAGSLAAYKRARNFAWKLPSYPVNRDHPAAVATSKLSIYLANGSLTTSQLIALMGLKHGIFLQQFMWREFYHSILWHCPRVEREAFLEKYKDLQWENNPALFDAWREGRTGYPIVDAGMRELATTGWMHNRVRMITALFLVKDLLIDWRWGEKHFMEQLLDGDLAANNGGWQWAASTSCESQPHFRLINPALQSEEFDKEGAYIRNHVPELKDVGWRDIHNPDEATRRGCGYPAPVVHHASRKAQALALFTAG